MSRRYEQLNLLASVQPALRSGGLLPYIDSPLPKEGDQGWIQDGRGLPDHANIVAASGKASAGDSGGHLTLAAVAFVKKRTQLIYLGTVFCCLLATLRETGVPA